jgi:8-oxo-dGTP diphosphatase
MDPQPPGQLDSFLARHTVGAEENAIWLDGLIRLSITCYLTDEEPPRDYIGAARAVVWRGDEVLTVRNADGWHVLPGGRREAGETPEQTAQREVLEETGVHIQGPVRIGFMRLHHLTPKPPSYEFIYPDFLSVVYVAQAGEVDKQARVPDDYEQEAVFRPVADARDLRLHVDSEYFLSGCYEAR